MLNRTPAHNLELEVAFIGEILIDDRILKSATIRPQDFYNSRHGRIYAECQRVYSLNGALDILLVGDAMANEDKNIRSYLAHCVAEGVTSANWRSHEEALVRLSKVREAIQMMESAIEEIAADPRSIDESIMEIVGKAKSIHSKGRVDIQPYAGVIKEAYEAIVERSEHPGRISGVTFGMEELDHFTDGLQPGELVIVAARPGQGKSAFSQGVMIAAAKDGTRVGLINLEMNPKQMGTRAMSSMSGMGISDLRRGQVRDWSRLQHAGSELSKLPIWVTNSAFSVSRISKSIDSMVNKGCKLIILDYLQLVESDETGKQHRTREQEVAAVSRLVKRKAQELGVSIVAMAQINRQAEGSGDKRPQIHHLRESGAIEQNADMVILLYHLKEECECPLECFCGKRESVEINIGKGRSTGVATFEVKWDPKTTTFSSKLITHVVAKDITGT